MMLTKEELDKLRDKDEHMEPVNIYLFGVWYEDVDDDTEWE